MQFYFIRHAQSENNALWDLTRLDDGRQADPGITTVGEEQAQALANHLASLPALEEDNPKDYLNRQSYGLTHLYSSLMVRALATATPVAEALGLPLIAWTDIHERGGVYDLNFETRERVGKQGNGRTYLKNRFPLAKLPADLDDTGWWGSKPYETKEDASARAKRVWDYLLDKHAGTNDRVAIVSHGGFFHSIMEILLNVDTQPASPLVGNTWLRMNNVAISRFDVHDDFVAVSYVNRIGYLPTALMT